MGAENYVIVGTAGHIDHGKTWLVQALTGIDTDRLKEEKERGISIELGFAPLKLPSGKILGLVDVPGHERFIRQMLAGAAGMDLGVLVVAADEGVMPQTLEHLAILNLLHTQKGLVVLTKKDLVDDDWLGMVKDDLRGALKGTFLQDAPILAVSAKTREGLGELLEALDTLASKTTPKPEGGPARLPIDRVFTLKGFGTVVTGTLWSGTLKPGIELMILPKGIKARIRGLEVHDQRVERALAGQRVAVNLTGVGTEELKRGDVLVTPGSYEAAIRLDVALDLLAEAKPLKQRQRVHFYLGTAEVLGRAVLLEDQALEPGKSGLARLLLESSVVAAPKDRFVIRSYSPMVTIGGGEVIQLEGAQTRTKKAELAKTLKRKLAGSLEDLTEDALGAPELVSEEALAKKLALPPGQEGQALLHLESLRQKGKALAFSLDGKRLWVAQAALEQLQEGILELLKAFHKAHPARAGISREPIREKLAKGIEPRGFGVLLEALESAGIIRLQGDLVALTEFTPKLPDKLAKAGEVAIKRFLNAKFQPPSWEEALEGLGLNRDEATELLAYLLGQGELIRLKEDIILPKETLERAKTRIQELIRQKGPVGVGEVRDALGSSRKLVIPLMEYFDRVRFTRRVGDARTLAEAGGPNQILNA